MTQGDFYLKAGTKLVIIVGQRGISGTNSSFAAPGGGASWVLSDNPISSINWSENSPGDNNLYCVAGGGGGEVAPDYGSYVGYVNVENAGITQSSIITDWSSVNPAQYGSYSSGGGGSYGKSGETSSKYLTSGGSPYGLRGAAGGSESYGNPDGSEGGFGGGGSTGAHASGGGGGYVGGNGGACR